MNKDKIKQHLFSICRNDDVFFIYYLFSIVVGKLTRAAKSKYYIANPILNRNQDVIRGY